MKNFTKKRGESKKKQILINKKGKSMKKHNLIKNNKTKGGFFKIPNLIKKLKTKEILANTPYKSSRPVF